jgi:hypothetical protein
MGDFGQWKNSPALSDFKPPLVEDSKVVENLFKVDPRSAAIYLNKMQRLRPH